MSSRVKWKYRKFRQPQILAVGIGARAIHEKGNMMTTTSTILEHIATLVGEGLCISIKEGMEKDAEGIKWVGYTVTVSNGDTVLAAETGTGIEEAISEAYGMTPPPRRVNASAGG